MNRPSYDKNAHYKKVRPSEVKVGDAITFEQPKRGVKYYRVTNTKTDPTTVIGYLVATKKKEDASRTSDVIGFAGQRAFLIERTASDKPAEKPKPKDEKPLPARPRATKPDEPKLQIGIVKNDGETTVSLVRPGEKTLVANDDHPNFKAIWQKVCDNDENGLADLFDIPKSVEIKFKRLSERVTVREGKLYLDNDPVDNSLTKQVLKYLDESREDWEPLVLFFEKVQANPSDNSRAQLHAFLNDHDLELTDEGDLITYKKVRDDFTSDHAGHGFSDGVEYVNAHIPNNIGSIVEMPRSEVRDNPAQDCSVGLHVATLKFARSYMSRGRLLKLVVNPRDVVSVPHADTAKVRVCRYTVLEEVKGEARF